MTQTRTVGILIFDDVEVLDFAGPFEVFGVAGHPHGQRPFEVRLIAQHDVVIARNGFQVVPRHRLEDAPEFDVLVVPGGGGQHPDGTPFGTRREMHNEDLLAWLRRAAGRAEVVLSVCTGALILARAGLLDGLAATTHHLAFDELRAVAPNSDIREGERVVDNGHIVLSGGIAAGIDAAFHVVARLVGRDTAVATAAYMEYPWNGALPGVRG